mmetsp:Transcript_111804/g.315813  ORF Transcript_111804/g.315813 Transcript_111804/m.315813 type:complete len:217 (-) Transcript_111804:39-689(-)
MLGADVNPLRGLLVLVLQVLQWRVLLLVFATHGAALRADHVPRGLGAHDHRRNRNVLGFGLCRDLRAWRREGLHGNLEDDPELGYHVQRRCTRIGDRAGLRRSLAHDVQDHCIQVEDRGDLDNHGCNHSLCVLVPAAHRIRYSPRASPYAPPRRCLVEGGRQGGWRGSPGCRQQRVRGWCTVVPSARTMLSMKCAAGIGRNWRGGPHFVANAEGKC